MHLASCLLLFSAMNHLAHLFLSQSKVELLTGNYIADHVKGKQFEKFSKGIQKGIMMHRAIDEFTDKHSVVKQSKERLYPKYHKYASVLVDMFYDHILAKNWSDYSPISLESFTQSAYKMLASQRSVFPRSAKRMYDHMSTHDWLLGYAGLEGMQRALNGLAYRAKFDSKMDEAVFDLERDYELYKADFQAFFPDLQEMAFGWLE